jgi:hypothetical protein
MSLNALYIPPPKIIQKDKIPIKLFKLTYPQDFTYFEYRLNLYLTDKTLNLEQAGIFYYDLISRKHEKRIQDYEKHFQRTGM